jgi:EVE domain
MPMLTSPDTILAYTASMTKHWIAIASADHVAIGSAQGFMQVNHGKLAPLKRLSPGDTIIYYSPVQTFRTQAKLQSFTAIGHIAEGEPYIGYMAEGFTRYRRNVTWLPATPTPITPLLNHLEFTKGKTNWGYQMRFGLFEIAETDSTTIARATGATP